MPQARFDVTYNGVGLVAIGLLARDLARTGDPAIAAAILKVTGEGSLWAEGVR